MNILTEFKDLLFKALKDNKKLIIGLYVLFIVCFVGAWIFSTTAMQGVLDSYNVTNTVTDNSGVSAVELILHNEMGGIVTYVSSVLFGIPAILFLIYNAVNLGMIGQLFSIMLPNGGLYYIIYIIPHGYLKLLQQLFNLLQGYYCFHLFGTY